MWIFEKRHNAKFDSYDLKRHKTSDDLKNHKTFDDLKNHKISGEKYIQSKTISKTYVCYILFL